MSSENRRQTKNLKNLSNDKHTQENGGEESKEGVYYKDISEEMIKNPDSRDRWKIDEEGTEEEYDKDEEEKGIEKSKNRDRDEKEFRFIGK